jgi:hypothetical protein
MLVGVGAERDAGPPYESGTRGRLIVELAIATHTAPAAWRDEDDAVIATAVDILDRAAAAAKGKGR